MQIVQKSSRKNNIKDKKKKKFKNCGLVLMWGLLGTFHRLFYLLLSLRINFLKCDFLGKT
jgi:hypothetical protein